METFDYPSLAWISSQKDISIKFSFAQVACGNELIERSPVMAGFFWKRENNLVWSVALTRKELAEVITHLESNQVAVPNAFREAYKKLN